MRKKWVFGHYDKNQVAELAAQCAISPFSALLLSVRGIDTPDAVRDFLSSDAVFSNPLALKDMEKAASIVRQAIDKGKRICIYGDYDTDGVTATAVLYSYLNMTGADVTYYIPQRSKEGYGLHPSAIDAIADEGTELVITVDTGITAPDAAERARERGMQLVITDHHKPAEVLPAADAVVDPHRADDTSGLDYLAGVGVAYKLVCAVEGEIDSEFLTEYLQLAALGTVADVMPLIGENRKIVILGLRELNENPLPGILALMTSAGLDSKTINSGNIAFGLAPRINASGRMNDAETALKLLLCDSVEEAEPLVLALERMNGLRHKAEDEITEEIQQAIAKGGKIANSAVLVAAGKGWHEGVIGIVASRVVEKYGKPAVILTITEDGRAKGSCRSFGSFSILEALRFCEPLLVRFGGHSLAAGLEILPENIDALRERLNQYAASAFPESASLEISCKLNPVGVDLSLVDSLEMLEPYGTGNARPVFAFCGMEITSLRSIGEGKHISLGLRRNGKFLSAVKFGVRIEEFPFVCGDIIDIAAVVTKNEYGGRVYPSVQIREIRFSGTNEKELFSSYDIYRKILSNLPLTEQERALAVPTRQLIKTVYQFIKSGKAKGDCEIILKRMKLEESGFCSVAVAVLALTDCGIIEQRDGGYQVIPDAPKADLKSQPLLARLGYRE